MARARTWGRRRPGSPQNSLNCYSTPGKPDVYGRPKARRGHISLISPPPPNLVYSRRYRSSLRDRGAPGTAWEGRAAPRRGSPEDLRLGLPRKGPSIRHYERVAGCCTAACPEGSAPSGASREGRADESGTLNAARGAERAPHILGFEVLFRRPAPSQTGGENETGSSNTSGRCGRGAESVCVRGGLSPTSPARRGSALPAPRTRHGRPGC